MAARSGVPGPAIKAKCELAVFRASVSRLKPCFTYRPCHLMRRKTSPAVLHKRLGGFRMNLSQPEVCRGWFDLWPAVRGQACEQVCDGVCHYGREIVEAFVPSLVVLVMSHRCGLGYAGLPKTIARHDPAPVLQDQRATSDNEFTVIVRL
ncbi:uncharacterized protein B0I36DRAFT_346674 [Microdochium trichocladiopsis]|uniref:Uncharacterized protein n=1 Tax=Microdochium trichocladiopsis TaxID=1682393 RepID=A0A9P9BW70_9PEZI|nr:uncharacterized protein B0I36DRAFT_346674 [Microdochium trichocladiopsis]KAH7034786.1 hypothetical protein B0I36DRAFT_346674 [Microdochium trichocladiopsis]